MIGALRVKPCLRYLDNSLVVTLADFTRTKVTPPVHKTLFIATALYGLKLSDGLSLKLKIRYLHFLASYPSIKRRTVTYDIWMSLALSLL